MLNSATITLYDVKMRYDTPIMNTFGYLQEMIDFFISQPSLEAIIGYRSSEDIQNRISHLMAVSRSGNLSAIERKELDDALSIGMFINLMQARAYEKLSQANVVHS